MNINLLLSKFYTEWHTTYCNNFKRKLKVSDETAEDLASKAYLYALAYSTSYQEGNFVTYMMGIMDNVIREYNTHNNYGMSKSKQYKIISTTDTGDMPELIHEPQIYDDTFKVVDIIFKTFKESKAKLYLSIYYEFILEPNPIQKTSEFLGESHNTTKQNVFLALRQCKKLARRYKLEEAI